MKCPKCNVPLTMSERQGVEIDYCPQCRGVWLDRGELDKIVERQAAFEQQNARAQAAVQPAPPPQGQPYPPPPPPAGYDPYRRHRDDDDDDDDRHRHGGQGYYPKRKKSWLAELFD